MKGILSAIRSGKAGYSIETAIVMTISFIVILFLIFMTFIMYEQVRINAIAQDAAERGALIYAVENKEMITGRISGTVFSDQNPYWRLADFGTNEDRLGRVKEYAIMKLNSHKLDNEKYKDKAVTVGIKNYFLYKRVTVEINVDYNVPFGGILNILIDDPYHITAYAEANVSEPAEFIRTLDLGSDIINSAFGDTVKKYTGIIQKAIDWINGH